MATSSVIDRPQAATPDWPPASKFGAASRTGRIPLLAIVFSIGLAMFITIDPPRPWILLVVTALVALGADGIYRLHPRAGFHTVADTAPHLFVPVLFSLSAGLFLE